MSIEQGHEAPARPAGGPWHVLRERNFRLFWSGQIVSMLGDQVHFIAAPWLVLQLTGSALALGTVMALGGVPRALFMLLGGAVTDRLSPRTVLLASTGARWLLTSALAVLVWVGAIELWMLYTIAFTFGVVDAFAYPAGTTLVASLVPAGQLHTGNALIQGSAQLTQLVGPALAGLLIAFVGVQTAGDAATPATGRELDGIAAAFGFDSLTFLAALVTLWLMRLQARPQPVAGEAVSSFWASIYEGLVYVGRDPTLRTLFVLIAAVNVCFAGPFVVGIPVLADLRFATGAAGYGMVMAGFGAGAFAGTALAGALPAPPRRLGVTLIGLAALLGIGLALLGFLWSAWAAAATTAVIGVANGYVNIIYLTWLQTRTPPTMLGRLMSLTAFASVGLVPVSMALAGALMQWNPTWLLALSGLLLTLTTLFALSRPAIRQMGLRSPPAIGTP